MIYEISHLLMKAYVIPTLSTTLLDSIILQSMCQIKTCRMSVKFMILRNFNLEAIHVVGAKRIAEAVAKYDIDRFIHVSTSGVNESSPSEFIRTKVFNSRQDLCKFWLTQRYISGQRRECRQKHISRNNNRSAGSHVRLRGQVITQACRCCK